MNGWPGKRKYLASWSGDGHVHVAADLESSGASTLRLKRAGLEALMTMTAGEIEALAADVEWAAAQARGQGFLNRGGALEELFSARAEMRTTDASYAGDHVGGPGEGLSGYQPTIYGQGPPSATRVVVERSTGSIHSLWIRCFSPKVDTCFFLALRTIPRLLVDLRSAAAFAETRARKPEKQDVRI